MDVQVGDVQTDGRTVRIVGVPRVVYLAYVRVVYTHHGVPGTYTGRHTRPIHRAAYPAYTQGGTPSLIPGGTPSLIPGGIPSMIPSHKPGYKPQVILSHPGIPQGVFLLFPGYTSGVFLLFPGINQEVFSHTRV